MKTKTEVDRISILLFEAFAKAEPREGITLYPTSYWATFADMARAVIADATPASVHAEADEATVEACAKAMWSCDEHTYSDRTWSDVPEYGQDLWRDRARACLDTAASLLTTKASAGREAFQDRVQPWLIACFGEMIAGDRDERNHRFLEEALELVQAAGCTASEAHQLVDYVFARPIGEPAQEVGGVMVTLAALCLANGLDMHADGEAELARIWTKVEAIRAKQAAKPKHWPLPTSYPTSGSPSSGSGGRD